MALVKDLNIIFSSITTGKSVVINYDQSSQALTSNKLFELIAEKEVRLYLSTKTDFTSYFFHSI